MIALDLVLRCLRGGRGISSTKIARDRTTRSKAPRQLSDHAEFESYAARERLSARDTITGLRFAEFEVDKSGTNMTLRPSFARFTL